MNCVNHPERERISFCQNCGKPLCAECSRAVGAGIFCEPCLVARLAAANAQSSGQTVVGIPVPVADGGPNPALAALLGFIPGVGAMYNGQYTKGVVHLIVFAVLVSVSADANGIVEVFAGLFIPGWEFYMAFEAYHTARARRDGTPLPNPFGLNDVGERLGFGKSWMPSTGNPAGPTPTQTGTAFAQDASGNVIYTAADGATFTQSAGGAQTYSVPGSAAPPAWSSAPNYSQPFAYTPTSVNPYTPTPNDIPYTSLAPQNRFPTGAIVLIGLGLLFFFGSTGILHGFPIHRLFPFFLIGLGVWLFFQKMTAAGQTLQDDGSAFYGPRLFSALRGSAWIVLVGILFFLDSFDILSWGRSWPLIIILAGAMTLLQRYAYSMPPSGLPGTFTSVPPDSGTPSGTSNDTVSTKEPR